MYAYMALDLCQGLCSWVMTKFPSVTVLRVAVRIFLEYSEIIIWNSLRQSDSIILK